jgi:4a-hydroxytetrahydrobiopterin dehydratase
MTNIETRLVELRCKQYNSDTPPLSKKEAERLLMQVPQWALNGKEIRREFKFQDFRQAMDFVDGIAELAEDENHHPDILISYNKVKLTLSTHKIGGLSPNDFILAAKVDRLLGKH